MIVVSLGMRPCCLRLERYDVVVDARGDERVGDRAAEGARGEDGRELGVEQAADGDVVRHMVAGARLLAELVARADLVRLQLVGARDGRHEGVEERGLELGRQDVGRVDGRLRRRADRAGSGLLIVGPLVSPSASLDWRKLDAYLALPVVYDL
jgi:hypothetical protein